MAGFLDEIEPLKQTALAELKSAPDLAALAKSVRQAVAGGFSEIERTKLRGFLQRVIHNMDRFHNGHRKRPTKEAP